MSFLQPMMLIALPLVALPVIIHLINQRRYQTTRWGAMMFLLAANRMSRGYARIRQWLILLFRMAAIAGLLFAVSRPLASGWLGLTAGGRADTTIILLDRSPSMQQQGGGTIVSKLETGRRRLAETLSTLGSTHWVLIDSASRTPRELTSPDELTTLPCTEVTSTETDMPAMIEAAHAYIKANQTGRTEIWICSDLRANDWQADSRRWKALRDSFLELPQGVRFHLLAYAEEPENNVNVRVTNVRRLETENNAELLVSLLLSREGNIDERKSIPVQFEIDGARSELTVEMVGPRYELKDHRIPLESKQKRGWGRVSIPADINPANDEFYFVFDEPAPRKTIIVAEDPQVAWPLELAAATSPEAAVDCLAEVVSVEQLSAIAWEQVSLLLWQAPLPRGEAAEMTREFINRGGQAIFLPPHTPDEEKLFGVQWQSWTTPEKSTSVETWRGDQGLLAHTLSGESLPVGELKVKKYCKMSGDYIRFASLRGGEPFVGRVATDRGGVHFCTTTPSPADSSLAADGVVFYVAVQRALAAGSSALGNTRNLIAGRPGDHSTKSWKRLAGSEHALSTDYAFHQGVYGERGRLLAVNRAASEDNTSVVPDARVAELFDGLDFVHVDALAGDARSLIQEIWRLFLVAMILAMVIEAALCLPTTRPTKGVSL